MKDILRKDINELSQHLLVIQNKVIGLFKPRFYPTGQYIPVVENDNGQLYCIEIGGLLGLQHLHIGASAGHYVEFPKTARCRAQTMADMMKEPLEFHKWYTEHCTR